MKKLKIIKKYWVKKQNDDIQSTILLCTFGSLKWESKEGNATEEIREIIKSLANRKDWVTKFPNIRFFAMQTQTSRDCLGLPGWQHWRPTHQGRMCTCGTRWNSRGVLCSGQCWVSVQNVAEENRETEKRGEKGRGALHQMCINQHKRCISLQPWSTSVPAELLQLMRHLQKYFLKKGSYLSLGTVLSHDRKCYCNKQSHRNQNWNMKLQNQFLGHTYRHRSGNLIFIFSSVHLCMKLCRGWRLPKSQAFLNAVREI